MNYQTATLKELTSELGSLQKELPYLLEQLSKEYSSLKSKFFNQEEVLNFLRYYYEQHSINTLIKNSKAISKIIYTILSEKTINGEYITRLEEVAEITVNNGLAQFQDAWRKTFKSEECSKIYALTIDIDEWIRNCRETSLYLKTFAGNTNPIQGGTPNNICEIKKENQLFINGENSGIVLTPKPLLILNKLLETTDTREYKVIKTATLKRGIPSDDAFRANLRRLRKITKPFFYIKNSRETIDGSSGYVIVFPDQ